jgi:hypothetical protein
VKQMPLAMKNLTGERIAANLAARARRDRLLSEIARMKVTVRVMAMDQVRQAAIHRFNRFAARDGRDVLSPNPSLVLLDRITVNYIRHELTNYDRTLTDMMKRYDIQEGADRIRKLVLDEIALKYPRLSSECERQRWRGWFDD